MNGRKRSEASARLEEETSHFREIVTEEHLNRQIRMDDYVSKLQEDLRTKLDRLSWMHNEPGWYVSEYFVELRKQVDLDAERQLSEIQSEKRKTDSDKVNETRLEFIRILEELEKRTGLQTSPPTATNDTISSLEERIDAFNDSSSSLDDLEDLYVQLAREIIDQTDRTERRLLGEQTIIYWPHQSRTQLGSLVYFGDIFLSQKEIRSLMSQTFPEKDRQCKRNEGSLLVPVRELNELSKSKQVVKSLAIAYKPWGRFDQASKFFYVGKSKEEYSGYSAEGSSVEREFFSYQFRGIIDSFDIDGETLLDTSLNLFDLYSSGVPLKLRIKNLRMESLHANLLPSLVDRLSGIELFGVHLDSIDTDHIATFTSLTSLKLQTTFAKQVKFELAFLGALRWLVYLELSLPYSPLDTSVFLQLTWLRVVKLEGSSYFYAQKLPRLSKADLEQILSSPRLQMLELSFFQIEAINRNMFSKCCQLKTLTLARNLIDRGNDDDFLNLGFHLCYEKPKMKEESTQSCICIMLIHSDIPALSLASFAGMSCLMKLSLSDSSIADLPLGVFQDLHNLERLDLDNNRIRYIRRGVFDKLRNLSVLKMDANPIESIEANAFCQLINLSELSFERCCLKSIDNEMFNGLVRLFWLKLKNNLIERIEVVTKYGRRINVAKADLNNEEKELVEMHLFADNSHVWSLDLSGNKLEKLDLNCFSNLICLYNLDLSSNMINELKGEAGPDLLAELGELRLTDNRLTTIDQRALPKTLTDLHLSRNRLKRLDEDFFVEFKQLACLNLDQNELTWTITEGTFASCRRSLVEINLSQNELIQVTEEAFLQIKCLNRIECNTSEHFAIYPQYNILMIRRLTFEALQALKKIHLNKLDEVKVWRLSNCSIKSLTRNPDWPSNQNVPEMDQINLSWISSASRLIVLDLSRNLIETLDDPQFFADLKSLTKINLSNNRLNYIHRDIFKCLSCLCDIDLSGNNLTSIDTGLFRHISTSLTHLDLSSNCISFLNLARLFRVCPHLKSLDLANNQLEDRSVVEPIDGRSSHRLEKLVLANNRFKKMNLVRGMTSLKHLDLRGNRIESVMSHSRENLLGRLRKLTHLDLSGNQIRLLRDEMFAHLRGQLNHLDLSGNPVDFQLDSVLIEFF